MTDFVSGFLLGYFIRDVFVVLYDAKETTLNFLCPTNRRNSGPVWMHAAREGEPTEDGPTPAEASEAPAAHDTDTESTNSTNDLPARHYINKLP